MLNKTRIKVLLAGGLGNQLFQLADALADSKSSISLDYSYAKNSDFIFEVSSQLRISSIDKQHKRWGIEIFLFNSLLNISGRRLSPVSSFLSKFYKKFCLVVLKLLDFSHRKISIQDKLQCLLSELFETSLRVGYCQDQSISKLDKTLYELRREVFSSNYSRNKEVCNSRILVVHIRHGDYLGLPNFGLLTEDYYHLCIKMQMQLSSYDEIIVYTDAKANLARYIPNRYIKITTVVNNPEMFSGELLERMREGKGYVLANSTLSWWAAQLSYTPNPIVLYPSPWFAARSLVTPPLRPHWIPVRTNFQKFDGGTVKNDKKD